MRYYSTIKKRLLLCQKYIAHSCGGKPRVKLSKWKEEKESTWNFVVDTTIVTSEVKGRSTTQ